MKFFVSGQFSRKRRYPDRPLFDALSNLQKDKGIRRTGEMRPGDDTEQAIRSALNADASASFKHENQKGKYIWRTRGDSKVRSEHAERDGNPPSSLLINLLKFLILGSQVQILPGALSTHRLVYKVSDSRDAFRTSFGEGTAVKRRLWIILDRKLNRFRKVVPHQLNEGRETKIYSSRHATTRYAISISHHTTSGRFCAVLGQFILERPMARGFVPSKQTSRAQQQRSGADRSHNRAASPVWRRVLSTSSSPRNGKTPIPPHTHKTSKFGQFLNAVVGLIENPASAGTGMDLFKSYEGLCRECALALRLGPSHRVGSFEEKSRNRSNNDFTFIRPFDVSAPQPMRLRCRTFKEMGGWIFSRPQHRNILALLADFAEVANQPNQVILIAKIH